MVKSIIFSSDSLRTKDFPSKQFRRKIHEKDNFDYRIIVRNWKSNRPIFLSKSVECSGNYDTSNRMRYLVGKDAKMFWTIRRYFGDSVAIKLTKKILGVL